MIANRRNNDRRRRILYCAQQSDGAASSAASRREMQRLREARRPTALYGERVQRRLQGRWFSLVPIQRRTFTLVAGVSAALTLVLVLMHYCSVTWAPLAYREDIARPFRLDFASSFGRWYLTFLLAGIAGVSLMIYQLRRYRLDDYLGRYRLWRLVLITSMIASIGVSVSMVSWAGSLLDLAFGKRVALAGEDWIRLLVSIGGGILALRLIAEVYRTRIALVGVLIGVAFMLIPEAAGWNLFVIDSPLRWSLVTSAPLMAATAWWIGLGGYLRSLHREVAEIEAGPSLRQRIGQINLGLFRKDASEEDAEDEYADDEVEEVAEESDASDTQPKRRWWRRTRSATPSADHEESEEESSAAELDAEQHDSPAAATKKKKKKRRFGLGMRLQPPNAHDSDDDDASEVESETSAQASNAGSDDDAEDEEQPAKKRKKGLGGFLKRRKKTEIAQEEAVEEEPEPSPEPEVVESSQADTSDAGSDDPNYIDPDSIDWNGLSKSERRRLRKQLKRQGRAA